MAAPKQYRVLAGPGVVGFNGIIYAGGSVIEADKVPAAHLKAWLRFGQIEEIAETKPNKKETK